MRSNELDERDVEAFIYACCEEFLKCDAWDLHWVLLNDRFEVFTENPSLFPAKNADFMPRAANVLASIAYNDKEDYVRSKFACMTYREFKSAATRYFDDLYDKEQWQEKGRFMMVYEADQTFMVVYDRKCMMFDCSSSMIQALKKRFGANEDKQIPANVSYIRHNV